MPLTNAYVLAINRLPDLFKRVQDGQAPERFTIQLLKDWGFTSTNDRAFIPLLKALGFITPDGKPTQRYLDYRDHSRAKQVLGHGVREAYEDLFLIKSAPTAADRPALEGKFKSFHNVSDNVATNMAKTFLALLPLADLTSTTTAEASAMEEIKRQAATPSEVQPQELRRSGRNPTLHYNVQIHLPPTKDIEVYNAIFKSLKEHLFD